MSLEVSPLLAYDTARTLAAAKDLSARAARPNLFIKIPGTPEGLPAIEEAIFAGVSINVTLLFSREQYLAAAEAYLKGIERRIAAGLPTNVGSVASVFISRWDVAVAINVPEQLRDKLGIAIAQRTYKAYRDLLAHAALAEDHEGRIQSAAAPAGEHGNQRSEGLRHSVHQGAGCARHREHHARGHSEGLCRSRRGGSGDAADGGDCEQVLPQFTKAGVDIDALGVQLQDEGAKAFVNSWNELMGVIESKSAVLNKRAAI